MKYLFTTKKKYVAFIKNHLKDKVTFVKTNEDGSETIELNIEDGDDLLSLIYVGMDISDSNHESNWYYSESDL